MQRPQKVLPQRFAVPAELLRNVDFPIVSMAFAESEEKGRVHLEGLRELVGHGARLAIATLGERGALAFDGERSIECPAYPVDALDTTGAGDAFRGGFIWALLRGYGAESAVRTANAVAAMNCRVLGAQGGLPDRGELEAFLADATPRS